VNVGTNMGGKFWTVEERLGIRGKTRITTDPVNKGEIPDRNWGV